MQVENVTPDVSSQVKAATAARQADERVALPGVLRWFWALSVVAFLLMILVSYLERRAGIPLSTRGPLPDPLFGDLLEYLPTFKLLHTPEFFTNAGKHAVAYPPFGAALFAFLYAFGHPVICYLTIAGLGFVAAVLLVRRGLIRCGIAATVATLLPATILIVSFPFEALLQRANIELFVWIFVSAGVCMIFLGRDNWAAALWGAAAAIKLYPILLLVLFLRRDKLRPLSVGCASFALLSLASLRFLSPDVALAFQGSARNVAGYQGVRTAMWNLHELAANHSAFEWFKLIGGALPVSAQSLSKLYIVCGGLAFALAYFGRARRMPLLNQLLVVIPFMVLLPPVSYYYTLTNLYAPWVALAYLAIRAKGLGVEVRGLRSTILLFVPVFAAFSIFTFRKVLLFGGLIQSLVMVCILIAALQHAFTLPEEQMEQNGGRA
jgi:hypothetical protein